jgi:nucleoside-diphosphate kinase
MANEETLVLLKPDTVRRRLVGRIMCRFEDAGLEIKAIRMIQHASEELISNHYRSTEEWLKGVGEKTVKSYREKNLDIHAGFGTHDPIEIGRIVKRRLIRYMTSAPIIAVILAGNNAIKKVRDLAGYTIPAEALPGTIRSDFSCDSPDLATLEDRSVENLIHASGNAAEAVYEIDLWFRPLG